jgi:seryl-tRNA synthetase
VRNRLHPDDDKADAGPYREATIPTKQLAGTLALLDIKWIRDNQDAFLEGLKDRVRDREPAELLTQILKLDEERRGTIQKLQDLQARRNAASKEVGQAKASKDEAAAKRLMDEVAELKGAIQLDELTVNRSDTELRELMAGIPNLPLDDVPIGPDGAANTVLREVGAPPKFDFQPKQHFELGEALGLMDFETAAKLSGSRFVVLKGALARLERALAQFMLDLHTGEHGYTEINPPLIAQDHTMFGTAQLPKFRKDQYPALRWVADVAGRKLGMTSDGLVRTNDPNVPWTESDEEAIQSIKREGALFREVYLQAPTGKWFDKLWRFETYGWLIPTAEVPLTNLVREAITEEAKLPMRVTAWTPCFRAEAGAAGKDTRGMIRQHQFSKVELVSITTPEQSSDEHERMTTSAEEVLKRLGLPYRVIVLSTGDMGFAARKTYDLEVWLPGQGTYREISSCSVCGDFQARRMNARYRPAGAKETRFVHTLNGSGVAVGRALIAVLENYQEEDGSIRVPEALLPYMGGLERITATG